MIGWWSGLLSRTYVYRTMNLSSPLSCLVAIVGAPARVCLLLVMVNGGKSLIQCCCIWLSGFLVFEADQSRFRSASLARRCGERGTLVERRWL